MEFKDSRYWLTLGDSSGKPIQGSTEVVYDGFNKISIEDLSIILKQHEALGSLAIYWSEQDQLDELRDQLEDELLNKLYEFASIDYSDDGPKVIWSNRHNYKNIEFILRDYYRGLILAVSDMNAWDYTDLNNNWGEVEHQAYAEDYGEQIKVDYIEAVSRIDERIQTGEYVVHKIIPNAKYFTDDPNKFEPEDILDFDEGMYVDSLVAAEMENIALERYRDEEKLYEERQGLLGDISLISNSTGNPLIVNKGMAWEYQENSVAYGIDTARAILVQQALEGALRKRFVNTKEVPIEHSS